MTKTSQRKNDGTGNPNRASLEKSREAKLIKTKKSDSQIQCPLLGDEWTRRGHCGTYAIDPMGHVWRSDPARLWPGGAFCWLSVCLTVIPPTECACDIGSRPRRSLGFDRSTCNSRRRSPDHPPW